MLRYSGNSVARALRKRRSDTVGLIVPEIGNPFFSALAEQLELVLAPHGQQLLICGSGQNAQTEAARIHALLSRQVDGIIVVPADEAASTLALQDAAAQVPLVQVDQRARGLTASWVGVDDDSAMALVLTHLAGQGIHTAAFIGSQLTNSSATDRYHSFLRQCERLNISVQPSWTCLGDYSVAWGRSAATDLLGQAPIPDAIVCANDMIALGAIDVLRKAGLQIPKDVAITGFDNTPFAELLTPTLTSVDQPTHQIAQEAVRLIEEAPDHPPTTTALAPHLILRHSA